MGIFDKFNSENALSEEPSRAELLQFLDTYGTTQASELAYKWIVSRSFQRRQRREAVASGRGSATALVTIATVNLFEMLSSLADIGERAGFSIDASLHNETLVVAIGGIPEEMNAALFTRELIALIFARLSSAESHITHTKNIATVRISMNERVVTPNTTHKR